MNYQRELDKLIEKLKKEERVPRLLLHSCCAPCSSYVMEYLSDYFEITVFYYNPNIYPESSLYTRFPVLSVSMAGCSRRSAISGTWISANIQLSNRETASTMKRSRV